MKKLLFLTILSGMFLCSYASAQTVKARGIGRATYSCPPNRADVSDTGEDVCLPGNNDKEKALENAKMNAIERYFAERGEAETENFIRMEDEILDNLDRIILSDTILNEQDRSGRYEVTISVELNEARLRNIMRGGSAAGAASKTQKSEIAYLFTGREVGSVTKSGPAVTATSSGKTAVKTKTEGTEGERITASKINTTAERTDITQGKTETKTSSQVVLTRDQLAYKLLPMSNYDTSITNVFSLAGFTPVDSRHVLSENDFNSVNNDYEQGEDISVPTLNSVVSTLRDNTIPYLALATLDVDQPTKDSATGMNRVVVRAVVRVWDLTSRFPREVASVPPYQIVGLGATDSEAQNNALRDSSERAAREIVQRLNALDAR